MSTEQPSSDPIVEIYAGLGTLRECRWKGRMTHLPRVGDQIALTDQSVYDVSVVRFRLDEKKPKVEIYVR